MRSGSFPKTAGKYTKTFYFHKPNFENNYLQPFFPKILVKNTANYGAKVSEL